MLDTLYYKDPYLRAFDAAVTACTPRPDGLFAVVLSDTAFYPEGGGQPGDTGTLAGVRVADTREQDGRVVHLCRGPLAPGRIVHGEIDWARRFRHMQCHTGEHIFSGVAHALYGCRNVGFHISRGWVTIDLTPPLSPEQLAEAERQSNAAVFADVPTVVSFPDADALRTLDYRSKKAISGPVRIVRAGGRDVCACCGLHVARSGEVGCIKVGAHTPHRGGVRLTLYIGWDALHDYHEKQQSVAAVSHTLSAKPHEVAQAVARMAAQNDRRAEQIIALHAEIFRLRAALLPRGQDKLWTFAEGLEPVEIRQFADILAEQAGWAAVFSRAADGACRYAICSRTQDVRPVCRALHAALGGRGGGKAAVTQGAVPAEEAAIAAFCRDFPAGGPVKPV